MALAILISRGDRRLLARLLRSSLEGAGTLASVFRARNPQFLERLDTLEADGLLRRSDDQYFLTLVALSELSSVQARAILHDAKRIFRVLGDAYQTAQAQPITAQSLADRLGLTLDRTLLVLRYMVEAPWAGGYSNLENSADISPSVTPSEKVLQLKTFSAVIRQVRQWHVDRMASPHRLRGVFGTDDAVHQVTGDRADRGTLASWPFGTNAATNPTLTKGGQHMPRAGNQGTPPRPELAVPLSKAQALVQTQIDKGVAAPNESINENDDARAWYDYTSEVLRQICTTDELVDEFTGRSSFSFGNEDISTGRYLKKLRSIYGRLELLPVTTSVAPDKKPGSADAGGKRVFIVHGHDDGAKDAVARFLQKLDLQPVVLHEQPNKGRTIIEKFEDHSAVAFAVVLFTPDDVGHPAGYPDAARPRARQNVLLELGFFMHAIGRDRVCVLYKVGVEIPSDYAGVLYHELDKAGAWQVQLAKEMKAVGLPVDMNDAF
jgi:predicted nucleotide-binding protein